ncbi:hypothetical protein ACFWUP_30580 [Nocardia sp. NPDC058658]|uniref:TPR repeat region-containing protein n=1 Tax=Nocardia sp. NPDC058658 TaxID=3346580 RepID=UPI0036552F8C
MPTLSQVKLWNPAKLSEWAGVLEANVVTYEARLSSMTSHFTGAEWAGKAKDAAGDRFAEESTQGRFLSTEIRDIVTALRAADTRLSDECRLLLGHVTNAEQDTESPIRLQVNDRWVVSANGAVADDAAKAKVVERIDHHQGLINAAYRATMNAASEASTAISTAAQEVRVRGDQLGSGIDATDDDFSGAGLLGGEDGKRVREAGDKYGKIDPAVLDEVASRLPVGVLTDAQLADIAAGREVSTLPASVQDYYREFYKAAGSDGVLALSERLKEQELAGNTAAAGRRDSLANGLMVLSNEKIGTGVNKDGTLQSAGSYQNLPQEIRDVISTRVSAPDGDGNALTYPKVSDWNEAVFLSDSAKLSDLLGEANPGYTPGTEFSREMIRQAATLGQLDPDNPALETTMRDYVDVGSRNHTAMTQLLTGETEPGEVPLDKDYDPNKVMMPLLQYDWTDNKPGESAPDMFSWIGTEAIPVAATDSNPGVTVEESQLAGRAARGLTELMTGGEDGNFEALMNIADKDNQSLGQVNPGLTQQITTSMLPYLDSIAVAPDSPTPAFGLGGEGERDLKAIRLSTLFNTDPESSGIWNAAIVDKTNEYAAQYGNLSDEPSNSRGQLADAASRLLSYQDQGILGEAYDRGLDDTEAKEELADKQKLGLGIGTTILKDTVGIASPGAGIGIDIVSKMIDAGIKPEDGEYPESYYKAGSDTQNAQFYYSMLQGLSASDPNFFDSPPAKSVPIPSEWVQNGRLVDFQAIVGEPGSEDSVQLTNKFRSAAESWLIGADANPSEFVDAYTRRNIGLDDYTSSAADYKNRVLKG